MFDNKIKNEYRGLILGVDNLSRPLVFNKKFLDEGELIHLMYELNTGEVILTKNGLRFIKDYWGFEKVAKIIFKYENGEGDFVSNFSSEKELVEWLKNYKYHG